MKRTNVILILVLTAVAAVMGSCKRTNDGSILGPKKIEARDGFEFTEPKHYNYLTSTGTSTQFNPPGYVTTPTSTYLGARINMSTVPARYLIRSDFNQEVTWFLEIYQPLTGAKKTMTGTSSRLDSTNALWDGTTSNNMLFHAVGASDTSDHIIVTLTFLGTDKSYSKRIKFRGGVGGATGKTGYEEYYEAKGATFVLVDDFDGSSQFETGKDFTDSRLRQEFFDAVDGTVILENSYTVKANRDRSFHFKGTDANKNAYIGGINTFSLESLTKENAAESKIPNVDPSEVYINLFVYGSINQTTLQLKVYELDDVTKYQSVNPSFEYNADAQKSNDAWTYDLITSWQGWKLVSIKYSDFKRANDPNLGGNGNGVKEPNRISGLAITLSSQEAYPSGEAYIDYVNLTTHYPFVP